MKNEGSDFLVDNILNIDYYHDIFVRKEREKSFCILCCIYKSSKIKEIIIPLL